jgi:hypothetical protein
MLSLPAWRKSISASPILSVIVDRSEIGDGATVAAGERVGGNFAIPHRRLSRRLAAREPKPQRCGRLPRLPRLCQSPAA